MDLERQLREALLPMDPGPRFTAAVVARLGAPGKSPALRRRRWAVPASIAATLLAVTITVQQLQQQREQKRVAQAQAQLIQALDITSRRLEAVHHRLETQFAEDLP